MRFVAFTALTCAISLVTSLAAAPAPKPGPVRALVVSSNKSGNWEIYLVQPGSGETKQLTDNKASDTEPVWSPDGKQIAFVSDREGAPDIWVMNTDGTEPKQLTKKTGGTQLRWSPDVKRIAFVAAKVNKDQVHTVDVATSKVTQLTTLTSPSRQPAWSPDGKTVSYTYHLANRPATYTVPAGGGLKKRLTDITGGVDAAWSSDGKRVLYVCTPTPATGGGWRINTIGADGKDTRQLASGGGIPTNVSPQWSPDGSRISYGELVDGVLQVAVMKSDGSDRRIITSEHLHSHTRWSPDGLSISYTRLEKGQPAALWISDPDGGNTKELLRNIGTAEWKPR